MTKKYNFNNTDLKKSGVESKFKRVTIFCLIQGINNYVQINRVI